MPRHRRFSDPGICLHVVQRGNDRRACFFGDADRLLYLQLLREAAMTQQVAVHAWVLMGNHVHLLLTPVVSGAVSRLMQSIGRCYVRYVNRTHRRSGTLWEGRFRSCAVDTGDYALACYRYIELNPVRARMVEQAVDYRWSSHASNAFGADDGIVQPHSAYLKLGSDVDSRREHYRSVFATGMSEEELGEIRARTQQQRCFGGAVVRARFEAMTGFSAEPGAAGRPKKS